VCAAAFLFATCRINQRAAQATKLTADKFGRCTNLPRHSLILIPSLILILIPPSVDLTLPLSFFAPFLCLLARLMRLQLLLWQKASLNNRDEVYGYKSEAAREFMLTKC